MVEVDEVSKVCFQASGAWHGTLIVLVAVRN